MKKMRILALLLAICLLAAPAALAEKWTAPMYGASLEIPAGWSVEEETESNQTTVKLDKGSTHIVYTGVDMYASMAEENGALMAAIGFKRADVNNDFFGIDGAADVFSLPESRVRVETCGNAEFFRAEATAAESGYGIEVGYALNYTNGYMHLIMYMGPDRSDMGDFETVLDSFLLN